MTDDFPPEYWFYVEPYVHLACKSNDCLLYNTLTGEALVYWDDPGIAALVRRLSSARNSRVIGLGDSDMRKESISTFVGNMRKHYMGDLLDTSHSSAKPVQMVHSPKIQKDAKRLKREKERSVGEGELEYLSEISLYINTECRENCPDCRKYYRQFPCCTRPRKSGKESSLGLFSDLLGQIKRSRVSRINVLGGDIFLCPDLPSLVALLRSKAWEIAFHLHYLHLAGSGARMELLDLDSALYQVIVTPPYSPEPFGAARNKVSGHENRTTFVFVVRSDADIQQAKDMVESHGPASYVLKPYFDGNNAAFFHESVFMNLDDILNARPSHREIYANQVLNRLNFGRLTVMNNGKVYANLNQPALGAMGKDSILQILYREMYHGRSWRRTRLRVEPCRHCVLAALCPPPGNYEFALKRNDLCHVREEKDALRVTELSSV